jgi:hypothetical protein
MKQLRKIALVTLQCANNYGAILQVYAMCKALSKYGEVRVVDYDNRHISRSFDLIRFRPTIHGLLGTAKDVFRIVPRRRAIQKFKKFIEAEIPLTERMTSGELMSNKLEAYNFDVFLTGSDQVWNPVCVSKSRTFDMIYLLAFVANGTKKIAYASSAGGHTYSKLEEEQLKDHLRGFSAISVRESDTAGFLQNLLGRQVEHSLDPTLLLVKEAWQKLLPLERDPRIPDKYILLYTVPKKPLIRETVREFSKKLKLPVVSLEQGLAAGADVDLQVRDAGPREFLELFSRASFVVTDSFHGTCFSLNFEKPFVSVSPGKNANRIESLLELVGLPERCVDSVRAAKQVSHALDFSDPRQRLQRARENSTSYLSESLDG